MTTRKRNRLAVMRPSILILEGLWSDTAECVREAGGEPFEIAPWDYMNVVDELRFGGHQGLILTGGSDIDPRLYHEKPHPECYGIDGLRDMVEYRALELAQVAGIPVLGICRGSQIMCAFRGGKLTQHIEDHRGTHHPVFAEPGARTFPRACGDDSMDVVSLHHQCVRRPGKGMRIAARAMDGTPEAIESKDGLWLGCQFHPEINGTENRNSFAIFRWLVTTAAARVGGRAPKRSFRNMREQQELRAYSVAAKRYGLDYRMVWGDDPIHDAPTTRKSPTRLPRRAGEASLPSMRAMTAAIEAEDEFIDAAATELLVCSDCGLLFDSRQDRDDHEYYLHHQGYDSIEDALAERYPELQPPAGHPAWDDAS